MAHPRRGGRAQRTVHKSPRRSGEEGVLYGLNPVEAALVARRRRLGGLCLKSGTLSPRLSRLKALASEAGLSLSIHPHEDLEQLAGSPQHQGAVLRCGPLPLLDDKAAWEASKDWLPGGGKPPPLLVALDQVSDPRNLGAVVRSCAAFGARGLVLPRDHSAPLSAAASSASAGALERFPVHETANLARFLDAAKDRGFWVAGAVAQGGTLLPGANFNQPLVLVLGSEDKGLRPLVERQCDHRLTIPLPGLSGIPGGDSGAEALPLLDSLNVASAASVLLYALTQVFGKEGSPKPPSGKKGAQR